MTKITKKKKNSRGKHRRDRRGCDWRVTRVRLTLNLGDE